MCAPWHTMKSASRSPMTSAVAIRHNVWALNFTPSTWLLFLLAALYSPAHASEWAIVQAGSLLAEPSGTVETERSVVIRDGRIHVVVEGYIDATDIDLAENDTVIVHDLSALFVLPGFIDGHVHLTGEWSNRSRLEAVEFSAARVALEGAIYANRTLMTGITTVRDLRGNSDAIFALRDVINAGRLPGPRILAAGGMISPTGGHGDVHGYNRQVMAVLRDAASVCNGPDDCRRAVREQVLRGADLIKLASTGGVTSEADSGTGQLFTEDELVAIVDAAHQLGRRVTAHSHGADGIKAALRSGVDSIEHGTSTDDEAIRLFLKSGAYLVPTLLPGRVVLEMAFDENSFMSPAVREKSLQVAPQAMQSFTRAYKAGVKVAFGSDSGVGRHGDNLRELLLLAEAGLTPQEVIVAATMGSAENLGMTDTLGSITVGKHADLIALRGDPLVSIEAVLDVSFVMKDGRAYKVPVSP